MGGNAEFLAKSSQQPAMCSPTPDFSPDDAPAAARFDKPTAHASTLSGVNQAVHRSGLTKIGDGTADAGGRQPRYDPTPLHYFRLLNLMLRHQKPSYLLLSDRAPSPFTAAGHGSHLKEWPQRQTVGVPPPGWGQRRASSSPPRRGRLGTAYRRRTAGPYTLVASRRSPGKNRRPFFPSRGGQSGRLG